MFFIVQAYDNAKLVDHLERAFFHIWFSSQQYLSQSLAILQAIFQNSWLCCGFKILFFLFLTFAH